MSHHDGVSWTVICGPVCSLCDNILYVGKSPIQKCSTRWHISLFTRNGHLRCTQKSQIFRGDFCAEISQYLFVLKMQHISSLVC